MRNLRIHKGYGLVYLDLALLSFLNLASLRMLRDYYLGIWKGNGRYFIFALFNFVVMGLYMDTYELSCGRYSPCPGEVSEGEQWVGFFVSIIHCSAVVDALKSTR